MKFIIKAKKEKRPNTRKIDSSKVVNLKLTNIK